MENTTNQTDNLFDITYDSAAGAFLKQAATWARICAVIGLISAGLSLIKFFAGPSRSAIAAAASLIVSLIFLAISVTLNIFLLRFANSSLTGLAANNQERLNEGVSNLGTYFKIMGILIIVAIALIIIYFFAMFFFLSNLR